ncbi:MAG: PAS domain S-box protein [Candidatus Manganitrophus sp. SA1]|nr:PAS domain S-box protein [Candidatus Manganitrophus morganii]
MNSEEKIKILLVDDREPNLLSLEAILASPDYDLVKAHSGREALRHVLEQDFAIILLDVRMPDLDGFETARLIKQRAQSKQIPIIFLSALYQDEENVFEGYAVGAVDYVLKPINPHILKSKVAVFAELYKKNRKLLQEQEARANAEGVQTDLSFLVNAGRLLASSLDYSKTLERTARLAVPKFADGCVVDLIEAGKPRRLAVAHMDPAKEALIFELQRRYPLDPNAPYGAANVLRSGEPELYSEIPDALLEMAAQDAAHLKILRGLGLKSAMVVPMEVRDHVVGAITFVSERAGRAYGERDLLMAQELARRAASAIENARLYSEAQKEIAERTRIESRLAAQHAVTRVLAESVTLNEATPKILQAICEALAWELGVIWLMDQEADRLRCVEMWHLPSRGLTEFDEACRNKTFSLGEGLPGRIWSEGAPAWISDVTQDPNFPREAAAAKEGLHAAFGFPIRRGQDFLGVIEFFSRDIREPDAEILQLMDNIGSQIGQFIERKQAEQARHESESRKAAILESALDCIITMDDKGRIIEFNPAAERTFGYQRDDVIGKEMAALIIPPSLREKHRHGLKHFLKTGEGPILGRRIEMTAVRVDGTEFPVELAVVRISSDGAPIFTGYLRDITKRKQAEEELKESERRFRQLAENIREVFWMSDPLKQQMLYISPAYQEIWGSTCESLYQKPKSFLNPVHPEDLQRVLAFVAKQPLGEKTDIEYRIVRPDGSMRWIHDRAFPIKDEAGQVYRIVGIAEDVTQQRLAEEELKQKTMEAQEASRIKSEFVSNVSHELRTPLNAIIGYNHLLLDETFGNVGREQKGPLEGIQRNAEDLLKLVNEVLDLAKIESGKMPVEINEVNLALLIQETLAGMQPLFDQKSLYVRFKQADPIPTVYSDKDKIKQILVNLLSNAIKFTQKGGITIMTTNLPNKEGVQTSIQDTVSVLHQKSFLKSLTRFIKPMRPPPGSLEGLDWA